MLYILIKAVKTSYEELLTKLKNLLFGKKPGTVVREESEKLLQYSKNIHFRKEPIFILLTFFSNSGHYLAEL